MYSIRNMTAENVQPISRNPKNTEVSDGALMRLNAIVRRYSIANNSNGIKASI
ncbi:hypothetical protein ACI6PS_05765 [Flavobacterium sp. PLA-1-15]|uniref:hypothetical protein n=1 Tax=Flavobacterium sp. PLA-1-15 TaxID=3380533 RepID=UPI003B77CBE9